ncbi:double-strand break repair helicase AddA [Parerythrobacter aurantius]|uniref:double-strand break repair helicase AddA n=1 Tax=Parerythrobacter aurantius TaxID=3127706 RepID=UPI003252E660
MNEKKLVHPLKDQQAKAVDPRDSVWLSASAGTGKTQVLSARVLRLLLQDDCPPGSILCLTFTKGGAAEMATRVNDVLARWVRLDEVSLELELKAIGAACGPAERARARTLFARVLDCPGGGLRIDTIHAFAQWLLAAFPEEAGLVPGTRALEDREKVVLSREVLSELLVAGDAADRGALAELSVQYGPDGAQAWLMRCADAIELWSGASAWQPPLRDRVLTLLGLPAGATTETLAGACADDTALVDSVRGVRDAYNAWGTDSAGKIAAPLSEWLAASAAERFATIGDIYGAIFNDKGAPKYAANVTKKVPGFGQLSETASEEIGAVIELSRLLDATDRLVPALTLGRKFALAWDERKKRDGLIDFDDQIRRAAELLTRADFGEWIRYKLDRRFDHILVDEAQDTNEAQWAIIRALTGDFFAGHGQHDGKLRTIFVVGDYKQAIFGFQGTSPHNFRDQKKAYQAEIEDAIANANAMARDSRTNVPVALRSLQDLGLGHSFRTSQPVLDFVDAAIASIGRENIGLDDTDEPHVGDSGRPGIVTLWNPVSSTTASDDDSEGQEEGWLPPSDRKMADNIARQVRQWLDHGHPLAKGERRNAGPGDIMVLVRKRKELAGLIVARLHAAGVPVAGVDRLRLGAPLAVKDLVAALRFAAQPLDDLNLANVLVSPLGGWTQDDLLRHAWRDKGVRLWDHLRRIDDPFVAATIAQLRGLLERVDFEPPEALIHWMLTGPWQGRRKLVARLGREVNDPVNELLNAAIAYSAAHTPTLAGFIQWFDAGDADVKREAGGEAGLVRVMTVHGSKGLQAPIVILADAAGDPSESRARPVDLTEQSSGKSVPMLPFRKEELTGPVAAAVEAAKAADMEEHWRLLYVAMTRAEEALYIGGALGRKNEEKGPAKDSWYARLEPLMPDGVLQDDIWFGRREWGALPPPVVSARDVTPMATETLPLWATTPVGPEPRPPRPLAPSSAGEDRTSDPPLPPGPLALAAQRGVLLHTLLERMPVLPADARESAGREWLARQAGDLPEALRDELLSSALAVLSDARFASIFGPESLAEVPLAATVGGQVIAGTVDRLLVTEDEIVVVDFKTARRPPEDLGQIPEGIVRQMAAYAAALEMIYPGRSVRAAVLYTHIPQLFALPETMLAPHKAALQL